MRLPAVSGFASLWFVWAFALATVTSGSLALFVRQDYAPCEFEATWNGETWAGVTCTNFECDNDCVVRGAPDDIEFCLCPGGLNTVKCSVGRVPGGMRCVGTQPCDDGVTYCKEEFAVPGETMIPCRCQ